MHSHSVPVSRVFRLVAAALLAAALNAPGSAPAQQPAAPRLQRRRVRRLQPPHCHCRSPD